MFKRISGAIPVIVLALALTGNVALAVEPTNLSLRKGEMVTYVSSGDYAREVADVALAANKFLAKRIPEGAKPGKKLAIVFDIDETLLSNLTQIVATDYGYVPKIWDRWVAEGQAPAIIPVQTVYDAALRGKSILSSSPPARKTTAYRLNETFIKSDTKTGPGSSTGRPSRNSHSPTPGLKPKRGAG